MISASPERCARAASASPTSTSGAVVTGSPQQDRWRRRRPRRVQTRGQPLARVVGHGGDHRRIRAQSVAQRKLVEGRRSVVAAGDHREVRAGAHRSKFVRIAPRNHRKRDATRDPREVAAAATRDREPPATV